MDDYFEDEDNYNMYEEDFGNSDEYNIYENENANLYSCIVPSVSQISIYIGKFIVWNIAFRLTTQLVAIPKLLLFQHAISICFGVALLYFTVGKNGAYLVFYSIIMYVVLIVLSWAPPKRFGYILGFISLMLLVICEIYEKNSKIWHQIRGIQMIAAMKIISFGFDIDSGRIDKNPDIISFLGYCLCPANSIVGPWVPYTEYLSIFDKPKWNSVWFVRIVTNTLLSVLFLVASNCLVPSLIADDSYKWLVAYRDALSFRSSHYFISFLSQASMVCAGFGKPSDSYFFGFQVTKPILVEIPRSIVQIVVAWNVPMHNWMKFYVFRNMKQYGIFAAITTTYLISALLHGLNFQLAAVLLSLGFYTYIEYQLRDNLSRTFKACILPNECRDNCVHEFKSRHPYVILVNLLFGAITVLHLAYLGVMFEASANVQEQGFSWQHTLNKWQALDYTSHWIAAFSYVFYFFSR